MSIFRSSMILHAPLVVVKILGFDASPVAAVSLCIGLDGFPVNSEESPNPPLGEDGPLALSDFGAL